MCPTSSSDDDESSDSDFLSDPASTAPLDHAAIRARASQLLLGLHETTNGASDNDDDDSTTSSAESFQGGQARSRAEDLLRSSSARPTVSQLRQLVEARATQQPRPPSDPADGADSSTAPTSNESVQDSVSHPQQEQKQPAAAAMSAEPPRWRFVKTAKKSTGYSSAHAGSYIEGKSATELAKKYEAPIVDLTKPKKKEVQVKRLESDGPSYKQFSKELRQVGKLTIDGSQHLYDETFEGGASVPRASSKTVPEKSHRQWSNFSPRRQKDCSKPSLQGKDRDSTVIETEDNPILKLKNIGKLLFFDPDDYIGAEYEQRSRPNQTIETVEDEEENTSINDSPGYSEEEAMVDAKSIVNDNKLRNRRRKMRRCLYLLLLFLLLAGAIAGVIASTRDPQSESKRTSVGPIPPQILTNGTSQPSTQPSAMPSKLTGSMLFVNEESPSSEDTDFSTMSGTTLRPTATLLPSAAPSYFASPSKSPTRATLLPNFAPQSALPTTSDPTNVPTDKPSETLTLEPSLTPSTQPSLVLSAMPSVMKSGRPSSQPSESSSTSLPTLQPLQSLPCPDAVMPTVSFYVYGTRIEHNGTIFECSVSSCATTGGLSSTDGWQVAGVCNAKTRAPQNRLTARPSQFPSQLPSGRPISSVPTSLAPTSIPITPTPTLSLAGACPEEYTPLSRYSVGTQVQLGSIVFECVDIACGYDGFEPEPSLEDGLWRQVWDVIGTCSGTYAPATSSPTTRPVSLAPTSIPITPTPTLSSAGACPEEYTPLSRYSVGTQVQLGGIVFECVDIACGYDGFEPEPSLEDGLWWQVWDVIGTCSGTYAPATSSPTTRPVSLAPTSIPITPTPTLSSAGACPEEYTPLSRYSVGTHVHLGGIVFECVDIACGYDGFEPEPSLEDGLWRQVWDVIGTCSGTFAPTTSSPTAAPSVNASFSPSLALSVNPSQIPSFQPSEVYSKVPSEMPSKLPTTNPTYRPSSSPINSPTRVPSLSPSASPLASPTAEPSTSPSASPLANPSDEPTIYPSGNPTEKPSLPPSAQPSDSPSAKPTSHPTQNPTPVPTQKPTNNPTINEPTISPTCSINGNFNLCVALDMSGSVCNDIGGGLCKDCFPDGWERGDENTCNQGGLTRSSCCPNFANMVQFTKELISDLGELPTEQDFSIVHFGDDAVIADTLESSRQAVKTLNTLKYSGGMTNMEGALNSCQSTLRGAPADRTNLLLIITDGAPNTRSAASAAAADARSEGTFIIPILIEEDSQPQNVMFLENNISSDGRVFVSTFGGLNSLQDAIFEQVTCQA